MGQIGEPDCRLVKPYIVNRSSLEIEDWLDFTNQNDIMIRSDDVFTFSTSVDGGGAVPVFVSSVDDLTIQTYTLEDGDSFPLADPLLINGTYLSNSFQTLISDVISTGGGNILTLQFDAEQNAGNEYFVFDNIVVTEATISPPDSGITEDIVPEPVTASLAGIGLAGLLMRRRRKA